MIGVVVAGGDDRDQAGAGSTRRFVALDTHRCEDLLRGHSVARVALTSADGPHIYPVTYRYQDHSVVFRTSEQSILGRLAHAQPTAVQVDHLDLPNRTGWSVLVRGPSRLVTDPAELVALWSASELRPWVDGLRNVFISVAATQITGRLAVDHRCVDSDETCGQDVRQPPGVTFGP